MNDVAPVAPTEPAPTSWLDTFQDAETKAWVENKGFHKQNVEALAKSYRSLEQMTGKRAETMIELPTTDDAEAWGKVYSRLGRPETPDKYEITLPEGQGTSQLADWSRKAFYEAGLTAKQAKAIADGWNKLNGDYATSIKQEAEQKAAQEQAELERVWGVAKEKNAVIAKGTAAKFGLSDDDLSAMVSAIGLKKSMEFLHKVGSGLGEQQFIEGQGDGFQGLMSPAQARVKEQELMMDPNFRKAFLSGDKAALERVNGLRRMAVERK